MKPTLTYVKLVNPIYAFRQWQVKNVMKYDYLKVPELSDLSHLLILMAAKCSVSPKCLPADKRLLCTKSVVINKHLIDENLSNLTDVIFK